MKFTDMGSDDPVLARLILARLESLESAVQEIGKRVGPAGKTWLSPKEFAELRGVTTTTVRDWVNRGRFSEKAHRVQVTSGGQKVNQFHATYAPQELEAGQ